MKGRDPFNLELGARIRFAREAKGFSRESLAKAAGISPQFLAELEIGSKGASAKTICSLCKALKATPNYLLLGREDEDMDMTLVEESIRILSKKERSNIQKILQLLVETIKGEKR